MQLQTSIFQKKKKLQRSSLPIPNGVGSDDCDMSELGEVGTEFCQVGNHNCNIPFELYNLPDLAGVLTLDAWNNCLTEEDRLGLAEYLPDLDQETYMRTLKELFSGSNFHFGSPIAKLFDVLKRGLCEPRVTLYQQGLDFFLKCKHYHLLWKYQNSMVSTLTQMRNTWENCTGYGIEERLRVLNIMRSQKSLMYEKMEDLGLETDSSEREESGEGFWNRRLKNIKLGPKTGSHDVYAVSPTLNNPSRGRPATLEPAKYGKQNPKGILKFAGSKVPYAEELSGRFPSSIQHGLEMKSRACVPTLALRRQDRAVGYDSRAAQRTRGQIKVEEDAEEPVYEMALQRDRNATRGSAMSTVGLLKSGKKSFKREDEYAAESLMGLPFSVKNDFHSHGRSRTVDQMAEVDLLKAKGNNSRPSFNNHFQVAGKKAKYLEKLQQSAAEHQIKSTKDRTQHLPLKGNRADWSAGSQLFQHNRVQDEAFPVDYTVKYDDWQVKGRKGKIGKEFQTGKNSVGPDRKVRYNRTFSTQMDDTLFHSNYSAKTSQEKIRRKSSQNGGMNMEKLRHISIFTRSEETESDSSEQVSEEEDINSFRSKIGYPRGVLKDHWSAVKSVPDPKRSNKLARKEFSQALDGVTNSSKKVDELGEWSHMPDAEIYSSKGKQKGRIHDPSYLRTYATGILGESNFSGLVKSGDDRNRTYKSAKNGQMQGEPGERLHLPLLKAYPAVRKQKETVDHDYSVPQSSYMHDYIGEEDENLHVTHKLVDDYGLTKTNRLGKKGQNTKARGTDCQERSNMSMLGCNSKKRKGKVDVTYTDEPDESDYMHSSPQQQIDGHSALKKRGKRKVEAETGSLAMLASEPLVSERGATEVEPDGKPVKKPFILITPTVHADFSFSIIHLLSAVRMAMITPHSEDDSEVSKHIGRSDGRLRSNKEGINGVLPFPSRENVEINNPELMEQNTLPSLTVQEIVNRVRSNPGDPCILETQETLQDLVRGVLKIFLSKTAPLGAKGWKPLVFYEKSTKCWSWLGPVSPNPLDDPPACYLVLGK